MELTRASDVKDNRKGFWVTKCRWKNMDPLLKEIVDLIIYEVKTAEVLGAFFASVFTSKIGLDAYQAPERKGKVWSKEEVLVWEHKQTVHT